jgi:adenosylcobinamide-phosphate synthase
MVIYLEITLLAYIVDKVFGEFDHIRHPVVVMGDYIKWFESRYYRDSISAGMILTISLLSMVLAISYVLEWLIYAMDIPMVIKTLVMSIVASTTIASHMLYRSVADIISRPKDIKYLVSRDTKDLSSSDINKAAIETYAENLSDGVVAPLLYLLLFGLSGAFVYKGINTLDSMVGYHNKRYENFGKFSAKLDDIANYIPSRITAIVIAIVMLSPKALRYFYRYGSRHDSPNAGHPISAMALALDLRLGGDTSYFGKIKKKSYFGDGKIDISASDIRRALVFQKRLDIAIIIFLGVYIWA